MKLWKASVKWEHFWNIGNNQEESLLAVSRSGTGRPKEKLLEVSHSLPFERFSKLMQLCLILIFSRMGCMDISPYRGLCGALVSLLKYVFAHYLLINFSQMGSSLCDHRHRGLVLLCLHRWTLHQECWVWRSQGLIFSLNSLQKHAKISSLTHS